MKKRHPGRLGSLLKRGAISPRQAARHFGIDTDEAGEAQARGGEDIGELDSDHIDDGGSSAMSRGGTAARPRGFDTGPAHLDQRANRRQYPKESEMSARNRPRGRRGARKLPDSTLQDSYMPRGR